MYYKRYHICAFHAALPEMVLNGALVRFCQQCGRFQALEEFDGKKKTCRRKLDMHNAQRKRKRAQKYSHGITTHSAKTTTRRITTGPQAPTNTPPPSPLAEDPVLSAPNHTKGAEQRIQAAVDSILLSSGALPVATVPQNDIANVFDEVDLDDLFLNIQPNRNVCGKMSANVIYQPPIKPVSQVPAAQLCPANNYLPFGGALPQHSTLALQPLYSTSMFPASLQPLRHAVGAARWAPQLQQRMAQVVPHQSVCNTGYSLFRAPAYNFLLDSDGRC